MSTTRRSLIAGAPAVAAAALAGGTAVNALAIAEAKAEADLVPEEAPAIVRAAMKLRSILPGR
jgi:hypothetical protein